MADFKRLVEDQVPLGSSNILTGTTDPNITPPSSFSLGDFYEWNDGGLQGFYQYNGVEWVLITNDLIGGTP